MMRPNCAEDRHLHRRDPTRSAKLPGGPCSVTISINHRDTAGRSVGR
jgi:hypothetical protein